MHSIYSSLVGKQFNQDKKVYETALQPYCEVLGTPTMYATHSPESIFYRFKDTISARVSKFIGIEATLERGSGKSDEDFYKDCKAIYKHCHPKLGNFDNLCECKEYLATKAKYSAYQEKKGEKEQAQSKKVKQEVHPIGTKRAKEAEETKRMVDYALEKASLFQNKSDGKQINLTTASNDTSPLTSVDDVQEPQKENKERNASYEIADFLKTVGTALLERMEEENTNCLISKLPTLLRKEAEEEQHHTVLSALKLKHCKLEMMEEKISGQDNDK